MKSLSAILLILLTLPAAAAPRIQLDPQVLKLGRMGQHEVTERDITVRNPGDQPLEIAEVASTCPCTFPEILDEIIPPGGAGTIHVVFQSKTYQGDVHKALEIYSNDPERPYLELPLEVFVDAPVYVTPDDRKLDFGEVGHGQTPALNVDFHAAEGGPLEIRVLDCDAELFDASVAEAGGPREARLTLSLRPDAPAGPFREIVRVGSNRPGAEEMDLEIFGRVRAELMAEPGRINFRMVEPGAELSEELLLRSAGEPFRITGAEIDLDGLQVEVLDGGPGRQARLRVHGRALAADDDLARRLRGRLKGTLVVRTDHPAQPELEVAVLYMMRI